MAGAKKSIGSQKKATKSKAAQSAADKRRQQRKASGQADRAAGRGAFTKARVASRASERRKKASKQAAAKKAAAVAKIKAAEKAAANKKTAVAPGTGRITGGRGRTVEKPGARAAAAARPAQAARMMAVNNPRSAPRTPPEMSPRNIAAQQAAARQAQARFAAQAAAAQKEKARVAAAQQAQSVTNKQNPIQKAYNDFLMDIGLREKTQDYYDRLPGRKDAAKKEQDRLREKRQRDRRRARSDTTTPTTTTETTETTTTLPPEIVDEFPPVMPPVMPPQFPQYPGYGGGMMGGIGAFGYNPALMAFESQQGAGQVPYYMAAARNAMTPNMSPAFMHAARNYDILGGMQRTAPRPMEMMSAAERAQIAGMSNFSTPNYNSPYDQFNFFSNMVGGGGGKGMGRPMPQMAGGLAPFMMGMS